MASVPDPRYSDTATFGAFFAEGDVPEPPSGNRYVPRSPHASGGLGEVLVAEDIELQREVALKRLLPKHADNAGLRRRFLTEAQITAHLEHPGVVPVHGLYRDAEGRPCYAMRFVRGETLQAALDHFHGKSSGSSGERRLQFRDLLQRFVAVCNAIAYAHSRGILHRDVKPQNVMLGKFGETLLVDWGLAKPFARTEVERASGEQSLAPQLGTTPAGETMMGAAVGTPAYMSPEQAAGRWNVVGPASDVYSLGATLYHLLTGKAPYRGDDAFETLQQVQRGGPVPPRQVDRSVPAALEAVCLKAMAHDPAARYASALELAEDVQRWLADEPVTARREPLVSRMNRWARRRRSLVAGVGALLVTAVVALAVSNVLITREQSRTTGALIEAKFHQERAEAHLKTAQEEMLRAARNELRATENEQRATAAMSISLMQTAMSLAGDEAIPRGPEFEALVPNLAQFVTIGRFFFSDSGPLGHLPRGQRLMARASWVAGGQRIGRSLKAGGYLKESANVLREALGLYGEIQGQEIPLIPADQVELMEGELRTNLGDTLVAGEVVPPPEAKEQFRRAAAIYRAALDKSPNNSPHADMLRYILGQLGNFHIKREEWPEAEAALRESVAHCQQMVKLAPLNADYHNALFAAQTQMAALHAAKKEPDKAAAAFEAVLKLREPLLKEPPQSVTLVMAQAQTCWELGEMLRKHERREEAASWYGRGFDLLEGPAKRYPKEVGPTLGNAYGFRAFGLEIRKRHTESIPDWLKAADLAEGPQRLRLLNSAAANRAAAGDHAKAVAEVEPLLADPQADSLLVHFAGVTFGWASDAARKDTKLPEAERTQLADRYANRAVEQVTRARALEVYKDPERVTELRTHPGFQPLHGRPAFDKLLKEIAGK